MNPPPISDTAIARIPDSEIFGDADYKHRLRLGRCLPEAFFRPWSEDPTLLDERAHWIRSHPERHALALPEAAAAIQELADFTQTSAPSDRASHPRSAANFGITEIGLVLEPDFVLMVPSPDGPRMVAASVCFPSAWCPETKLGRTLDSIHEIVPNLNDDIGHSIRGFFDRLKPGVAWIRANWGIAASPERNLHPALERPRPSLPLDPHQLWVRIEHQAIVLLPRSGAFLFGIRIDLRRLLEFRENPTMASALGRSLRTMPDAMARYKGLAATRFPIADWLTTNASNQKDF